MQPTAEEQIQFLKNLQRLLNEGQFVATYKYALLLALADLSVEEGDDSGDAWEIDTSLIAGKFVRYYWRQCVPYIRAGTRQGEVLKQNTGRTAAVVRAVSKIRSARNSIALAARDEAVWNHLIQDVDQVVRTMPLWKLQTLGGTHLDFLYENRQRGRTIELRPGVAYCLRQFHSLVTELVRHHWMLYIRRNNAGALGTTSDLSEFLFGGERKSLAPVQPVLNELQEARCFYCSRPSGGTRRTSIISSPGPAIRSIWDITSFWRIRGAIQQRRTTWPPWTTFRNGRNGIGNSAPSLARNSIESTSLTTCRSPHASRYGRMSRRTRQAV